MLARATPPADHSTHQQQTAQPSIAPSSRKRGREEGGSECFRSLAGKRRAIGGAGVGFPVCTTNVAPTAPPLAGIKRRLFKVQVDAACPHPSKRARRIVPQQPVRTIFLADSAMEALLTPEIPRQPASAGPGSALIPHTPLKAFWDRCIREALGANARETWIVLPASAGGQVFRVFLACNDSGEQSVLTVDEMECQVGAGSEASSSHSNASTSTSIEELDDNAMSDD